LLLTGLVPERDAAAFDLDDVIAKAEQLAKTPFQAATGQVPEWLLKINYDQWRDIRFRPDRALWKDRRLPFQVQFFHPGLYYDRTVKLHVVDAKGVQPVPFSPSEFDYGRNDFASKVPQDLGYAGLRIHYPLKTKSYYDEVAVFVGASYFRAIGRAHGYGLSARGIAIDTVEPSGEEFPAFTEFWLVTPPPGAKQLTLYALLDGPSITGAYRFVIRPGDETITQVDGRLFLRREVRRLGLACLTSMFAFGENTLRAREDFRPEVHDSDGVLLSFSNGEWLWRPLDNPKEIQINAFEMNSPKGFGLLQRDRDFDHYQDLETRAELRPSAWVTPHGDWGTGRVEVIQLPTAEEIHDNVVVFWVPQAPAKPGTPLSFGYTLAWYSDDPRRSPGGRAVSTRRDRGTMEDVHRFVIDFEGKKLNALPAEAAVRPVVSVASEPDTGEVVDQHLVKNPVTGGWRLTFQVRPKKSVPLELRAFLAMEKAALTETWSYVVLP
jgi:glucans biosynthesis protein